MDKLGGKSDVVVAACRIFLLIIHNSGICYSKTNKQKTQLETTYVSINSSFNVIGQVLK